MGKELKKPPIAAEQPTSEEILRVWTGPELPMQLRLRTFWQDPATWGLLLSDIARHVGQAYVREGREMNEVMQRIREGFDAEWEHPTDLPNDLTDVVD